MTPETTIGKAVSEYLTSRGWDVYPEVALYPRSGVADIVAVKGDFVWVVECKRQVNLKLFEQVWRWREQADYLSIGIPEPSRMHLSSYDATRDVTAVILESLGIGVFGVFDRAISFVVEPDLRARSVNDFIDVVRPAHRKAVAGQACTRRFTVSSATIHNLIWRVDQEPGISLRKAVSQIRHHYTDNRSAYRSLRRLAIKNRIAGIRCERRAGVVFCYPLPRRWSEETM